MTKQELYDHIREDCERFGYARIAHSPRHPLIRALIRDGKIKYINQNILGLHRYELA